MTSGRRPTLAQCALFIVCVLLVLAAVDVALAQPSAFQRRAVPAGSSGPFSDFTGWMFAKQAEFYRMLSGAIRAAKADGTAAWGLMGISFAYGIFHAAGPGHGKAVISSYLVANNETWRRGIALSFASAVLQSFTAIADRRHRRGAARRHRARHGQRGARDRDGELWVDHSDRPAAVMGEGPRLLASAAPARA